MEHIALVIFVIICHSPLYFRRNTLNKMHIALRVLISALYGSFMTVTFGLNIAIVARKGFPTDYSFFSFQIGDFLEGVSGALIFSLLGMILVAPLLLLALPVALLFRKNIERNAAAWCALATIIGSLIACQFYYMNSSVYRSYQQIFFSSDLFIVFWGLLTASIVFLYINPPQDIKLEE